MAASITPGSVCKGGQNPSNESASRPAPPQGSSGVDIRYPPPLDLPAPAGKEAEWALMRLARQFGVDCKYESWQELADAIVDAMKHGGPTRWQR